MEKLLGALPVVAGFCSRLKIRDIIDEACPVRDLAELTHGQVIEALVANRLTSPAPLVHVQAWAGDWAVGEALGVEPELLNDDRIGRALDAIAAHLDRIAGSVGVAAIEAFGVDVSRMHWDMTSISMHGEYEQAEEGFPAVRFGHPKDRRPDLKQVQAGIAVSGEGGVAIFNRAFDGGAGEVGRSSGHEGAAADGHHPQGARLVTSMVTAGLLLGPPAGRTRRLETALRRVGPSTFDDPARTCESRADETAHRPQARSNADDIATTRGQPRRLPPRH